MSEREKTPNFNDYLAGVMLANGFIWILLLVLGFFSSIFTRIPIFLLAGATYIIYLSGGIISSYLVSKRATSRHLAVGLKLAVLSWVLSIVLIPNLGMKSSIGVALTTLVCFLIGGATGAFLALRSMLRKISSRGRLKDS